MWTLVVSKRLAHVALFLEGFGVAFIVAALALKIYTRDWQPLLSAVGLLGVFLLIIGVGIFHKLDAEMRRKHNYEASQ